MQNESIHGFGVGLRDSPELGKAVFELRALQNEESSRFEWSIAGALPKLEWEAEGWFWRNMSLGRE